METPIQFLLPAVRGAKGLCPVLAYVWATVSDAPWDVENYARSVIAHSRYNFAARNQLMPGGHLIRHAAL